MLTTISGGKSPNALPSAGALEMLEGCHQRIRHFLQLSHTLAEAQSAAAAQIAEAAGAIYRYFSQSLPLHEADENQTLLPRLRRVSPSAEPLHQAAEAMLEQHHAINELVRELLELCDSIRREPELLPGLTERLKRVTGALAQIFESHLHMEETVIFPALAQFPAGELEAMTREMQQRRRGPESIHLVR